MGSWRLRPAYSEDQLRAIYATPHDHRVFAERSDDHELRVAETIRLIRSIGPVQSAADLSCGNGVLLDEVDAQEKFYGDFAPGWPITGPIERTLDEISSVDLFLCCETLEHLDDPLLVLGRLRTRARMLIVSTPLNEIHDDNHEHYWGWDEAGIRELLEETGWLPQEVHITYPKLGGYKFQIWRCD